MQNTSSSHPFSRGDRVRWRREIAKTDWVGIVTATPHPRKVQCDGLGLIGNALLEKVGEMDGYTHRDENEEIIHQYDLAQRAANEHGFGPGTAEDAINYFASENASLVLILSEQTDLIASLQAKQAELMKLLACPDWTSYHERWAEIERIKAL